jgi:serine/threonine-protein kinase
VIGRTLGHYRVVEPLGAGGMGEVFRAHDEKLDRDVALKVLPSGALGDEEARKRFQREANALSRLSHPHAATIFDFDTAEGIDFLVMELVRGPSLRDEIEEKGALPEKTVVRLGTQLARGLQAAHEQGIVHRDLKPGNLQSPESVPWGSGRVGGRSRHERSRPRGTAKSPCPILSASVPL